eukprot:4357532-Karenia_brevis.AAC.1
MPPPCPAQGRKDLKFSRGLRGWTGLWKGFWKGSGPVWRGSGEGLERVWRESGEGLEGSGGILGSTWKEFGT